MNSIVVCLFVLTLGQSRAAKIPTNVNKNGGPHRNPESLEKRSSELSNTRNSLIVKRTVGKYDSGLYFILPVIVQIRAHVSRVAEQKPH